MALGHPHSPSAPVSVVTENARPEWMRFGGVARSFWRLMIGHVSSGDLVLKISTYGLVSLTGLCEQVLLNARLCLPQMHVVPLSSLPVFTETAAQHSKLILQPEPSISVKVTVGKQNSSYLAGLEQV